MKMIAYGLAFLACSFNTIAENLDSQVFADIIECKAHYESVKEEAFSKLNKKKRTMGPGMPATVYNRKSRKINSKYESNLASCDAIAKF